MKKKMQLASLPGGFRFYSILLFSLFLSVGIYAQTVTGTVTDGENKPISGATVTVKGTTRATATNAAGIFSINASGTETLVISSVDFVSQEVPVNNRTTISVSLSRSEGTMDEVVVVALGIKKESKKLGYSATTANIGEITQNRTNNMMAGLEGKIAGLDISPPSAGPASSNKIRIRGQSAFAGSDNGPLIVVNGLQMNQGANGANGNASRDGGDNLLLFNPDDIESMTVLKGATAAAIYGGRASNGAIIITTKSGNRNTGLGVEITSGVNVDEVLDLTDYQYEYGQGDNRTVNGVVRGVRPGFNGVTAAGTGQFGWGERYDGVPTIQFDGVMRPYSPASTNRIKDFFNTGITTTNTVAVSSGGPKGSFRLSYSDMYAKGITPANEYRRRILNLNLNQNLSDKLSVSFTMNYTNDKNHNAPQVGVQGQGYMNFIVRTSPVVPLSALQASAANAVGAETPTNGFGATVVNPYFYIPRQFDRNKGNRILGTLTTKYQFFKWLYLQGRVAVNYDISANENNNPTGGGGFGTGNLGIYYDNTRTTYNGSYNVSQGQSNDINYDFILGGSHTFGDLSVDLGFSGNRRTTVNRSINAGAQAFQTKDLYTIGNGTIFTQGQGFSESWVNSLFGWAELGWKNLVFVNITGRNDWFSVLNPNYNSYFYPSVSGSFIFSELIKGKLGWLDYGKLRASWADVGQNAGIGPYYGNIPYTYSTQQYLGRTIGSVSGAVPNPRLSPYSLQEKEVGIELKMFKSRVNLDFAVYQKKTTGQILDVPASTASGTGSYRQNIASLENKGAEFLLDVTPISTRNFTWTSAFNTAYNISKVLDLGGVQRLVVADWYNNGASNEFIGKQVYEVGKPLAQIAARTYLRNAKGEILLQPNGRLMNTGTDVLFGSALPKWTGGWNNTFTYKNLSLLVHIDYKAGGKFISGSNLNALRQGHNKASLVGRREGENGVVFPGVFNSGPNAGLVNGSSPTATAAVFGKDFYTDYRSLQIADPFVYKSDFIKLRNVTLSYDLTSLIGSNKWVKGLRLSASCRNVAIIKKYVPDLDPEQVASTGDFRAGYEAVALPTTRTWGLNLNVKF